MLKREDSSMPRVFKLGPYLVYFWTNEGLPPEPVHVHVTDGVPSKDDTKIWITSAGGAMVCHNKGIYLIIDFMKSSTSLDRKAFISWSVGGMCLATRSFIVRMVRKVGAK